MVLHLNKQDFNKFNKHFLSVNIWVMVNTHGQI